MYKRKNELAMLALLGSPFAQSKLNPSNLFHTDIQPGAGMELILNTHCINDIYIAPSGKERKRYQIHLLGS